MSRWLIEGEDGDLSVLKDGRRLRSGLTEAEARKFVRSGWSTGDKLQREEPDGYRRLLRTP